LKTGSICSKVFDVLGYLGHRRDECSEIFEDNPLGC
jgi:hypothetical protein